MSTEKFWECGHKQQESPWEWDRKSWIQLQACPEAPALNLWEFFMEFLLPELLKTFGKRLFSWEKKKQQKMLGFERNSWESRAGFFLWFLGMFLPKEKRGSEGAKKIPFSFRSRGNPFPIPRENSVFKAAPDAVYIPRVWELKKKPRELILGINWEIFF